MVIFKVDSDNYEKYKAAISEKYNFDETLEKTFSLLTGPASYDMKADKFTKDNTEVYLMRDFNGAVVLYLSSAYKKILGEDISKNINLEKQRNEKGKESEKQNDEKAKEEATKKDLKNIQ